MHDVSNHSSYYDFGPGQINDYSDFVMKSSSPVPLDSYDVLIFTDSKGSVDTFVKDNKINEKKNITDHLWTDKICSFFDEKGISYLFISRPKILTIFFSLINFITKNNVSYKYLITNVGFVDFTLRKKRTCTIS